MIKKLALTFAFVAILSGPAHAFKWRMIKGGGFGCVEQVAIKKLISLAGTKEFDLTFAKLAEQGSCVGVPELEIMTDLETKGIGWEPYLHVERANGQQLFIGTGFLDYYTGN